MSLKKIKRYIIYVYLTILVIFTVSIFFLYFYMRDKSEKTAVQEQRELTEQYSGQIDNMLLNMDNITLLIMQDAMFVEGYALTDQNCDENYFDTNLTKKMQLLGKLQSFYSTNETAERLSIYNSKKDYLSYGTLYETNDQVKKFLEHTDVEKIIKEISSAPFVKRSIKIEVDERGEGEKLISVKRVLMNIGTGEISGVIDVQRKLEDLEKILDTSNTGKEVFVFNEEGKKIYSSSTSDMAALAKESILESNNAKPVDMVKGTDDRKNFLTWNQGVKFGWTVIVSQPEDMLLGAFRVMSQFIWIFVIGFMAGNLLLVFLVINKLMLPLQELSDSVSKVSLDNMTITFSNEGKMDEISRINNEFEKMFQRLHAAIQNEKKYHFEALQAQMNPHFLYNTLSVISAEAIQDNTEKIPELCDHLGKMLRFTSNYEEKVVTLKEELRYCRDYMSLMEERYQKKILYNIKISGDIEKVMIPKISIQPFLENCFKHGFTNKEFPWRINVIAEADDETWTVIIEDNGCGVTGEERQKIVQKIEESDNRKISGLGLINTIHRLREFGKEDIEYEILSLPEEGFTVKIGGKISA